MTTQRTHLRIAAFIGVAVGATLAAGGFWLVQAIRGSLGVAHALGGTALMLTVFAGCELQKRKAVYRAETQNRHENRLAKYESYYRLLSSWLVLKNTGRKLAEYFADHNYRTVAICGLGRLGIGLLRELQGCGIEVSYAIDLEPAHFSYLGLNVLHPDGPLGQVDVIVVTPVQEYPRIAASLRTKTHCAIVSLEDVVYSL